MGILEMIPPKYWRSLKRELLQINLDELNLESLPWVIPKGGLKAVRNDEMNGKNIGIGKRAIAPIWADRAED